MRRQMQLRPSQGGKMRGPVDNRPGRDLVNLEYADGMKRQQEVEDRVCRSCGFVLCSCRTDEPVYYDAREDDGPKVHTQTSFAEPLRYADGQEVRVGDVYVLDRDDPEEWSFEVSRVSNGLAWFADGDGELGPIAAEHLALRYLVRRAAPRIEVGMRVRVKDDAPHECRGKTGTYRGRVNCFPEGVWHWVEFDGALIHPYVRSLDHLEPIE